MIVFMIVNMEKPMNARHEESRRPAALQRHDLAGVPAGKQDAS
jgi:hypothetical protein